MSVRACALFELKHALCKPWCSFAYCSDRLRSEFAYCLLLNKGIIFLIEIHYEILADTLESKNRQSSVFA